MRGVGRGIMLAATGIIMAAGPARAQEMDAPLPAPTGLPPGAVVQPLDTGPGAELRRNLTALANNPRSLEALIGAGRAANAMGDGEAALGFFARADEISPGDARVKAGMGSALVQMERADQALTLFSQALALGAPEIEIAGDRGLAHDMLGDPRRAQQDYALALRRRADPEIERRLALSLAISGQREAALRVIDGQLRRRDRAAWRTQAFVLALTGDARGAEDTAGRMMPAANAQEMAPFFARLPSLSPAQKAAAVHFGRFPSDGRAAQVASRADTRADPDALALARNEPIRARPQPAEPLNAAPRRRPDAEDSRTASSIGEEAPAVEPRRFEPPPPEPEPDEAKPEEDRGEPPQPSSEPAREAPAFAPGAAFTLVPGRDQPRAAPAEPPPAPARGNDFGDVAALVQSLPDERAATPPSPGRSAASARAARASEPPARSRSTAANPARHWVQLAHAGAQSVLPREFAAARDEAPALLGSRAAYVALSNRVNRLLVGPFDSERAAGAFVGQLERRHVEAIAWTSPAGQEIERLRIPNEPRTARNQPEAEQRTAARGTRGSRAEPEPRSGSRAGRNRSGGDQRASSERTGPERRATTRRGRDEPAAARRSPARASRGKSEPDERPAARRRRSH
ncbi:MAG TPA: tetratricopeptide repeat protein [Allosphingosinicella sp.]|nr:tetratricopeptide repeat protein [Allosphingosinicella sp.]